MLTRVTTLMNHYTRALAQSGTFGSRSWAKAKECLDDPQYFLSSGFRIGRRAELTSKLKVEANPVILKIRILQTSRSTVKSNRGKITHS